MSRPNLVLHGLAVCYAISFPYGLDYTRFSWTVKRSVEGDSLDRDSFIGTSILLLLIQSNTSRFLRFQVGERRRNFDGPTSINLVADSQSTRLLADEGDGHSGGL